MKISLEIFLMTLLVGLVSTACEQNFLEPRDSNQQLINRVLRDPAYAEGLLHSAYSRLPSAYAFSGVATDDAVTNEKGGPYRRMATGEWSPLFSPVSVWDDAYAAIFHLNFLLSVAKDVEWSTQSENRDILFLKKNTGEAYALRGYFYLQLLARHGGLTADGQLAGVPIVTEPLSVSDVWQLPRASFQQVLDQIDADFDKALALLPRAWQNAYTDSDSLRVFGVQNQGRMQGNIIEALKAKTALLAASPAYNGGSYSVEKATVAATRTGAILKTFGGLAKIPAKGVVFYDTDKDITNPEILWRTDYFINNTLERNNYPPSQSGFGRVNPTQNLVDAFPMKNGYPIAHPKQWLRSEKTLRQPRRPAGDDGHYAGVPLSATPPSTAARPVRRWTDLNRSVYSTRTGYYLKKTPALGCQSRPGGHQHPAAFLHPHPLHRAVPQLRRSRQRSLGPRRRPERPTALLPAVLSPKSGSAPIPA